MRRDAYSTLPSASRYFKTADSESSVSSTHSLQSGCSYRSIDSRGPRRGRKQWSRLHGKYKESGPITQSRESSWASRQRSASPRRGREASSSSKPTRTHTLRSLSENRTYAPPEPLVDDTIYNQDASTRPSNEGDDPIFCTWPSCSSKFKFRSDWSRHEETVHYCPYHWVCCREDSHAQDVTTCLICGETNHTTYEHCGSCSTRDLQSRTFLREDQLSQHIKRSHIDSAVKKPKISKALLSSWRSSNPGFLDSYLRCGFCGIASDSWTERQDHVYEHLRKGICKSSWWPDRKAETSIPMAW
jgi:hypothetical protein